LTVNSVIETARLRLRPYTRDDLEPLRAVFADAYARRFYPLMGDWQKLARSIVTKIHADEGKVSHLVVNGETLVNADLFIFTMAPHLLQDLLPPISIEPKILQKMARTEPWTAVSLDLASRKKMTEGKWGISLNIIYIIL